MPEVDRHGPGVRFPPPLIVALVITLAWSIEQLWPLPIAAGWAPLAGVVLVAISAGIAIGAVIQFFIAKTHVEPWKPASTMIQGGLFALSRNPIYLAFALATPGVGLYFASGWMVAAVIPVVALLRGYVIRREEAYLEQKFGDEYRDYCRRVRRWM